MPTNKEVLIAAKDLIKDPANSIKGHMAADEDGNPINNRWLLGACKFCSMGAIKEASFRLNGYNEEAVEQYWNCVHHLQNYVDGGAVSSFHDEQPHHKVMDAFDVAIRNA